MDDVFLFVGGVTWLDFVNTEQMREGERVDVLPDVATLLRWLEAVHLLPPDGERIASGKEKRLMTAMRRLRASLREFADAVSAGGPVPAASVAAINEVLAARVGAFQIEPKDETQNGWGEVFTGDITLPEHLLFPLAQSAAQTLCHGDLSRVRRCSSPQCILRYYDTSKNGTRRWCSMGLCGNRSKVAAHYRRVRQA